MLLVDIMTNMLIFRQRVFILRRCFVTKQFSDEKWLTLICEIERRADIKIPNACERRIRDVLSKLDKREEHALSEMNSNEAELRCYANGNVNKADEVLQDPSPFSIYILLLNRFEK